MKIYNTKLLEFDGQSIFCDIGQTIGTLGVYYIRVYMTKKLVKQP